MTSLQRGLTSIHMGELIGTALQDAGITQAEFCRRVGVSAKHLNRVINGHATAHPGQLDYWAFVLGLRWDVQLVPRGEL